MTYWTIDGVAWTYPCTIKRVSEIKLSDISGLMLNRSYNNDPLGTYLRYEVAIAVPHDKQADYNVIYELLTNAVPYHTFTFPYAASTISFDGSVEEVSDALVRLPGQDQWWQGTTFTVQMIAPHKLPM